MVLAPQASVGRRERLRDRSRKRNRPQVDVLASRGKFLHCGDKVKMVIRLRSRSLLLATQLNLGKGVVKEGLMAREDRAKLELVTGVQLGALLAQL